MFVGREKELEDLNKYLEKQDHRILVLYGLKGIGKTTLLKHLGEDKELFYYEAVSCSSKQQRSFMINSLTNMGFSFLQIPEFKEIFHLLKKNTNTRKIVIIDEFHHLCKTENDFLENLRLWMEEEGKNSSLFFILCTSSIAWIEELRQQEREIFREIVPIFYRLEELKYRDFCSYFSELSPRDSIGAYSILGGIPALWKYFSKELNMEENIKENILDYEKCLYSLGQQFVADELRETAVYNTILCALAKGNQKLNQLYHSTGFSRAKISVYLKNLIQLGLVEKLVSLNTRGKEFSQKGIYCISHSYVYFYYRYLFGNQSQIRSMGKENFYERIIAPDFYLLGEHSFRKACMEFIEKENYLGRLPGNFTYMGRWFGKRGSVDFVYKDREEGEVLVGMCSWKEKELTLEEYDSFLAGEKLADIPANLRVLFSGKGFDNALKEMAKKEPRLALVSLEQMG